MLLIGEENAYFNFVLQGNTELILQYLGSKSTLLMKNSTVWAIFSGIFMFPLTGNREYAGLVS